MRKLAFILLALLLSLPTVSARNYIVCVGIADYPGTKNDLRLSADDALTMQQLYQKNSQATVRLFQNEQATVAAVTAAFEQLCSEATEDDAVLFYFSGHGVPGAFVCHDNFLKYDDIVSALARSAAKKKIILADACFAGKARRSRGHATAETYAQTSVLFFLSSRTNETSIENRRMKNSLFTAYLERGLRGGGRHRPRPHHHRPGALPLRQSGRAGALPSETTPRHVGPL